MPDQSQTSPFSFSCQGGLVLNQPTFNMQPGQALELLNFEPDIDGGYRRISGFRKYLNKIVNLLDGQKVFIPKRPGEPDKLLADISKIKIFKSYCSSNICIN